MGKNRSSWLPGEDDIILEYIVKNEGMGSKSHGRISVLEVQKMIMAQTGKSRSFSSVTGRVRKVRSRLFSSSSGKGKVSVPVDSTNGSTVECKQGEVGNTVKVDNGGAVKGTTGSIEKQIGKLNGRKAQVQAAIAGIMGVIVELSDENMELKAMLRDLKDVRAAVERFQGRSM